MYATRVKPENAIAIPEVVCAFVGAEDVKFAFLDNSDCCKGFGCPSLPPDSFARRSGWAGP
jgi:hypothetical protein